MHTVVKRFPVPQDNFVPVAISSNGLVGFTTQIGSDGKLERDPEGFSAPLISGSGAIMPPLKVFVNYFVVLFFYYYINLKATGKSVSMALVGGLAFQDCDP
ncbi:MAG: hypothetical protein VCA57_00505 [Pseudomonas sp.]|uniref:hypothetical protein n=1 Tax=Pseudomonas sp. TaxID=306 RepID=UPI003981E650